MPLRVHYRIADWILFLLIYHVARYRRKIVDKNLRLAFPDKTDEERKAIRRAFYHQFCDWLVETVYNYGCSDEELRERVVFEGLEEAQQRMEKAGGGIFMLGHIVNWEWLFNIPLWLNDTMTHLLVYKPLKNKRVDAFMRAVRSQRGGICVDKKRIFHETEQLHEAGLPFTIFMISDQKPRPDARQVWLPFLHQEVGFFVGAETLSKQYNLPVVYFAIRRTQRGYYRVSVIPIEKDITATFAQLLEQNILEQPQSWLWTHNRFKWRKQA